MEGIVGPGEVAADESNGDSHEVQAEPALVDHLRLIMTVEHVVPSRAEQAHLECVCVCVCVCEQNRKETRKELAIAHIAHGNGNIRVTHPNTRT